MHQLIRTIAIAAALLAPAAQFSRAQTPAAPAAPATATRGIIRTLRGGTLPPPGQTETPAQLNAASAPAGAAGGASALAGETATQEERIASEQQEARNRRNQEADGGWGGTFMSWIGLPGLGFIVLFVNYIVGMVGSTLFNLAGLLVEVGLYLNTIILNSEVVQLGWRISRDLANLGFTIGIVVIAYATMLGDESYGLKKTLLNFIVAAVMVNFSFSIAGFMIDGSNLVTHFFVSKSIGSVTTGGGGSEPHQFAVALANAFGPQRLLAINTTNPDAFQSIAGGTGAVIALIVSVFFVALFTIFAALGMLAVGLTTFQRFVILSGLVITMPVMILLSSFPKTSKYWEKWKGRFVGQLLYLPVATFTIYLTLMFVTIKARAGLAAQSVSASGLADAFSAVQAQSFDSILPTMARPFQVIIDMAITLGLLTTGIIESSKMSGAGGKIAIDMVKSVQDWAIGAAKALPGGAARKTLTTTFGQKEENSVGNWIGAGMAKVPLVRRLVPGLNRFMGSTSKAIDGYKKDYEDLTDGELLSTARSTEIRLSPERMAAMAKTIASKGLFHASDSSKGLTDAEFARFIPAAKRFGADKEVLKTSPHLYKNFGMDEAGLAKFMSKDFKPDDMDKINSESLKDAAVVRNLTNVHLKKLENPGKKDHRTNMIATLRTMHAEDSRPGSDTDNFEKFMDANFSQPKHIDGIHTDFLNEPFFVEQLKPKHFVQVEKETNFEQGTAMLNTLNAAYEDAAGNPERVETLDALTKRVVEHGEDSTLWAPIADDPATKEAFEKLRTEYLKRHELKGFNRTIDTPPDDVPKIEAAADGIAGAVAAAEELAKQERKTDAEIAAATDALMGAKLQSPGPWTAVPNAAVPATPANALPGTSPRVTAPALPAFPGTSARIATPQAQPPATSPRVTAPAAPTGSGEQAPATALDPALNPNMAPIDPVTGTRMALIMPDGLDAWVANGGWAPRTQEQAAASTTTARIEPPQSQPPATTERITPPPPAQQPKINPLENP